MKGDISPVIVHMFYFGVQISISSRLFVSTLMVSSRYIVSNHPSPTGGTWKEPHRPRSRVADENTKLVRIIRSPLPSRSGRDRSPDTPRKPPFLNSIRLLSLFPSIVWLTSPLIFQSEKKLISFSVVHSL